MNQIIVFSESLGDVLAPRFESYEFIVGYPKRVGDEAIIRTAGGEKVHVMLHECRNTVKPSMWLVEVKRRKPFHVKRGRKLL